MNFKIDKFEGPLGLLLQLIEKQELDITEISLAKIADQYIKYIKQAEALKPEELADFLVVAAKLLLIKSRALLPFLKGEEEEEIQEFEHQLKMYKEFLQAAGKIEAIIGKKWFSFAREFNRQSFLASARLFSPPRLSGGQAKNLTAADLLNIFSEIIKNIKPAAPLEQKSLEQIVNIEEKILAIQQALLEKIKVSFDHILAGAKNKSEMIVSFLALLELIKQKDIAVAQVEMFGEIEINKII
ncbi:MAG: segregation/condensation protein A [Parcubacteria group bacterium]|nr:segregation/condensation protein A [Parcubacteria group bacterium]